MGVAAVAASGFAAGDEDAQPASTKTTRMERVFIGPPACSQAPWPRVSGAGAPRAHRRAHLPGTFCGLLAGATCPSRGPPVQRVAARIEEDRIGRVLGVERARELAAVVERDGVAALLRLVGIVGERRGSLGVDDEKAHVVRPVGREQRAQPLVVGALARAVGREEGHDRERVLAERSLERDDGPIGALKRQRRHGRTPRGSARHEADPEQESERARHVSPRHVNPRHVNPRHVNSRHVNPRHVNPQRSVSVRPAVAGWFAPK